MRLESCVCHSENCNQGQDAPPLAVGHRSVGVILSRPNKATGGDREMKKLILAGALVLAARDALSIWPSALRRMS